MNNYTFTYYGFIPGYDDFDQEWFDINANTLEEAKAEMATYKWIYAKYGPELYAYNGVEVKNLPAGTQII